MGRVYLAKDTRLNRRVALKILSPERVNNPRAIARFHREALVGAQLQHENLVRIYDEGESNGKCYLVMEYIEGKNIGQMIAENGPIPPAIAARLARQVALGLEHAQRKGLIHRDVNPYNILVTHDGDRQAHRPGPGHRPRRVGTRHPRRGHRRHVRLRLARAGPALALGRHPQRHLFAWVYALSHAHWPGSIPEREPAGEAVRPPGAGARAADGPGAGRARGARGRGEPDDAENARRSVRDPAGAGAGARAVRRRDRRDPRRTRARRAPLCEAARPP